MNLANLCLGSTDESQKEVLQTESPQLSPPPPSVQSSEPLKKRTHSGIMLGCLSVFVSMVGASFTFPFLQSQRDSLGCDALCYGSMMSTRSALSLVGSVLVGRLSDKIGRIRVLWIGLSASILSYWISYTTPTVTGMWLALIPSSLLNQNYTVLKALFSEYNNERSAAGMGSESERASEIGMVGMAVGIAFMVGPAVGASIFKTYNDAMLSAMVLSVFSGVLLFMLPNPQPLPADKTVSVASKEEAKGLTSYFMLPAAQLPGSRLLFFMRGGMGIAYHVFSTVWTVTLKERFNFGPKNHAYFMGWVGLWYALSQGFFAKLFIRWAGEDPTNVILAGISILALGRVAAMMTTMIEVVYVVMAAVIVALGVVNTAISSAASSLADASQIGGLFGILEAVESSSGLVGPAIGGLLFRSGPSFPLYSVVCIYFVIFIAVLTFYRTTIVSVSASRMEAVVIDKLKKDK